MSFNFLASYLCIQDGGNAAMMSILQYLSPLFVLIGTIIFQRSRPLFGDVIVFILAMIGITLVLTKGDLSELSISKISLMWGIGAGLAQALYLTLPRPLIKQHYSPILIVGWGAFISGLAFNIDRPFWIDTPKITPTLVISMSGIILLGTILSFMIFLMASKFAPSEVVSLTDAVEPITAFVLGIIFFSMSVNVIEIIGAVMVIAAITFLQWFHVKAVK